jgi:RNA polymerase sigma-70 factor (ECF subfamily)
MSKVDQEKEKKFISVYESYVYEVYQYVYLRCGLNQAVAEDITQDVFLAILKGLNGFKGICSDRTWIYKITKNKLKDYYRKQYHSKFKLIEINEELTEEISDPAQDIDKQIEMLFERQLVLQCLEKLPEHYRITLLLKYIDNKSISSIADITGKTPKAVESMLSRARAAFIKQYQTLQDKEE